ncbi:MAG: hypothetical protein SGI92_29185 [Bryobacteraceae bacterium]|nr:hypothetical protein [Bryobacteraceae bacterium]
MGAAELGAARKAFAGAPGGLSDESMAVELGDWQAMTGDYQDMFRHRNRVNAVPAEQVRALAAETFRVDGRTVGVAPGAPVVK